MNRNRLTVNARKPRANDLALCHEIDKLHLERPFFGSRRFADELQARGLAIGRTRTRRLIRTMRLVATYPKPRTSIKSAENKVYPHLLRQLEIKHPNQVWCADITYIPMRRGFAYLVAIMDWHSRAILSWRIPNTLDTGFFKEALLAAHTKAVLWPESMNTDQRCQLTRQAWTDRLKGASLMKCMDGSAAGSTTF